MVLFGFSVSVFLIFAMVCGCGRRGPEVTHYEEVTIAHPAPAADEEFVHPPMGGSAPSAGTMAPARVEVSGDPLKWVTPEGWEEKIGNGMRLATFIAEGENGKAECSLITLSGAAGGLAANINRWIGQLGIDPLADDDMGAFLARQESFATAGGGEGVLVDLTSLGPDDAAGGSMLVGVVTRSDQTLFLKMVGSKSVLLAERARLLGLCKSFN